MATTAAIFRKLALTLPNVVENAHHGHPDFRLLCADGKLRIFCTLSGEATGRGVLMLALDQQAAFCEELPTVFEPVAGGWGRMGMTYVVLREVKPDVLLGALTTAHSNVTAKLKTAQMKRAAKPRKQVATKPAARSASKSARAKPKIKP